MQVQSGIGFDILRDPNKFYETLGLQTPTQSPTRSSELAPTKENAAKRAAQTQGKAAAQPKKEKKTGFGNSFQTTEPAYTRSPIFTPKYDWEKDGRERLQRFGITSTVPAATIPVTTSPARIRSNNESRDAYDSRVRASYAARQQAKQDEPEIITLPNGDEAFTPKGEASFLAGFASIYDDEPAQPKITARAQNRDAYDSRVRASYAARQQAENDAKYTDYDVDAAEAKLYDDGYWLEKVYASREAGKGFGGDYDIAAERDALEAEIERAKAAQERNKERKYNAIPYAEDFTLYSGLNGGKIPASELDNPRNAQKITPEENGTYIYLRYTEGEESADEYRRYVEARIEKERQGKLDKASNVLSAMSLIPGVDTFADLAAIPVDLARGDFASAGLDALGVIPFIGEVGDTAKLARIGVKSGQALKDADNIIDAARKIENADDVVDAVKAAGNGFDLKSGSNIGELAKPYPKENVPEEVNRYLSSLLKYGDSIEVDIAPSLENISLMSRQEAVEFASITVGDRNIIIRGDIKGAYIPENILSDMQKNKGILNCHSHPYIGDFRPSQSDLWLAEVLSHQKTFKIVTPDWRQAVYTKEGVISVGNIPKNISKRDVELYLDLFGG